MKYTCGIDWASDHHDVSIMNNSGMEVKRFKISNDFTGYNKLLKALKKYKQKPPIAIECKEHLIISFLISEGFTIYSINPKSLDRYKDRYNVAGNKTDPIDALALADVLRTDIHKHNPLAYSSENVRKLQMYCREYDKLLKTKNILECQLHELLHHYFPLVLTFFSTVSWNTICRLIIRYPNVKALCEVSYEELKSFLYKNHYTLTDKIDQMYEKIRHSEHCQNDLFDEVYSITAVSLAQSLLILLDGVKSLKIKMVDIVDEHSLGKIFRSLPGSGDIMSAKLLAVMGDNKEQYANCLEIQALAGLVPVVKESGKISYRVFRKACNKAYRTDVTWYAFCSLRFCKWAKEFYDKKREEGKRHFESLRLLGFKWMRIIYSMWIKNVVYDETYHLHNLNRFRTMRKEGIKKAG